MPELSDLRGIGPATAAVLAEHGFGTVQKLARSGYDALVAVPGFGAVRARAVLDAAREALGPEPAPEDHAASTSPPVGSPAKRGKKAKPAKGPKAKKKKAKDKAKAAAATPRKAKVGKAGKAGKAETTGSKRAGKGAKRAPKGTKREKALKGKKKAKKG